MQIRQSFSDRNSEDEFSKSLQILSDAGSGVIHVRTGEVMRAVITLRRTILVEGDKYHEWDVNTGFKEFEVLSMYDLSRDGDNLDLNRAMMVPLNATKESAVRNSPEKMHYFVVINPQYWWDGNPVFHYAVQQAAFILPSTNVALLLVTPDIPMPDTLSDLAVTLRFDPPSHKELTGYATGILHGVDDEVVEDIEDEDIERICFAGSGMSKASFETYMSLSIVEASRLSKDHKVETDSIVSGIGKGKTEIVNRNDLLELYPPESMSNVGGMGNLKEWVSKRAGCYSDEAAEFGIEPPKGMVFVGVPGTGKSLAAKAIARELGVPLIRLDFGRVFNSLIGKSEERIRVALRMVESMAPCVLFCDEIDKGLGGIGGSGDSGTSSRVLGTFLTWLQDNTSPVFTMVTANNINALPPELMRRGRFDAIFSSTLPDEAEREEVLRIHLRKRGWDPEDFDKVGILSVVNASSGYVPAEIESAVKDALVDAFSNDQGFSMDHVVNALSEMVPLSKSYAQQIMEIQAWAEQNATPASYKHDPAGDDGHNVKKMRRRTKTTH